MQFSAHIKLKGKLTWDDKRAAILEAKGVSELCRYISEGNGPILVRDVRSAEAPLHYVKAVFTKRPETLYIQFTNNKRDLELLVIFYI